DRRSRGHPLPKFLGECCKRGFVHAERPQAVPCEGHRHPAAVRGAGRGERPASPHAVDDPGEPGPALGRVTEGEESVPGRPRGGAGEQEVLDVVEVGHHWILSSMSEKACLSRSAFLISSAVTYGYSPYSRKLRHWCSRTNFMKAGALVFQSIGKPSRFSNTVLIPDCWKRAIASSVYLSKSVSKIP